MKLTILGAAGVRTPLIVKALAAHQSALGLTELHLMDIDPERLDLIGALMVAMDLGEQLPFKVHRTTDARAALLGADFVITTFRVGGIESRIIDERIPLQQGVLGQETTGPGGFALGLRSIPVLLGYIAQMRELCPQAWLINFANPAGMLAEAAQTVGEWDRVVGICDAPSSMARAAAALIGIEPDEIFLDYFGLNHLGWVRSAFYHGRDLLPGFLEMIHQSGGMPGLPFEPEFLSALGMIPNEYLVYYYAARQSLENLQKAGQTRGEIIAAANSRLFDDLRRLHDSSADSQMPAVYQAYLAQRSQSYMQAETGQGLEPRSSLPQYEALEKVLSGQGYAGVAIDLMESLLGARPRLMILNIPNQGAIPGMDPTDGVEVSACVTRGLIRPLAVGTIPDHMLGLMRQVKAYERLTIRAAVEGSYALAHQALVLHPLVQDITKARAILDGYIQAHGPLFPTLT